MKVLENYMSKETDLVKQMEQLAKKAKAASLALATISDANKNDFLEQLADALEKNRSAILEANAKDVEMGESLAIGKQMVSRLALDDAKIDAIIDGVKDIRALKDPVGEILELIKRPNQLAIQKVRVPIGVVAVIYESRPNVTIDCAALCVKAGNAVILRGGREAFNTNKILAKAVEEAIESSGLPEGAVQMVPTVNREAIKTLLKLNRYIDCVIPRGGEALIEFVIEESKIPVIKHSKGVCSIYIDKDADLDMAESILINAKCQNPAVCNAAENLFIHKNIAPKALPRLAQALHEKGVELRLDGVCEGIILCNDINIPLHPATEMDFHTEYLDLILSVKIVSSVEDAIRAVNTYGSGHSDAIVTEDEEAAQKFLKSVDSAAVYWNASTRFTDGNQFGFGAEIGISTDKLHARGPMGIRDLCTYKYVIRGNGQVRE